MLKVWNCYKSEKQHIVEYNGVSDYVQHPVLSLLPHGSALDCDRYCCVILS